MTTNWQPEDLSDEEEEARPIGGALMRGALGRCPNCGRGHIFGSFLKVRPACEICGEAFHHHRADDAPPYMVIFIVGHIVVSLVMSVEFAFHPPLWVHIALWIPITLGLALLALPPVKGAIIALQWALRMHGFGGREEAL